MLVAIAYRSYGDIHLSGVAVLTLFMISCGLIGLICTIPELKPEILVTTFTTISFRNFAVAMMLYNGIFNDPDSLLYAVFSVALLVITISIPLRLLRPQPLVHHRSKALRKKHR